MPPRPRHATPAARRHVTPLTRFGLVVHPSRDLKRGLDAVHRWAGEHGVELSQIPTHGDEPDAAAAGEAADADLIVALGGDGTVLAALHAGAPANRAVLGIACGSLGALAAVPADGIADALDRVARGDFEAHPLSALEVRSREADARAEALNDFVVVRAGAGQVRVSAAIDGVTYARW